MRFLPGEHLSGDCLKGIYRCLRLIIVIATFHISTPAWGEFVGGIKVGPMMVDTSINHSPVNVALNVGYEIDNLYADLHVSAEITRTVSDGETSAGDDLEFKSNGLYLVYKTIGALYFTLRGGIVEYETIESDTSSRSAGASLGGGFGVTVGRALLQLEYTSIAGDANYLSLGLLF